MGEEERVRERERRTAAASMGGRGGGRGTFFEAVEVEEGAMD